MLLWQAARNQARRIRASSSIGNHGLTDLIEVAETLGATVSVRPLKKQYSGVIIKKENSEPEIFVNSNEPLTRQRFTLAHEIGHLIERTEVANDEDFSFVDTRSNGHYDLHEFFADEFAGELLMPADEFDLVLRELGEYGAASHFGVSVMAIRRRNKRLAKNPARAMETMT